MVITVSTINSYVVNQLVYLSIPQSYGMIQANQLTGEILATNGTNLTLNIDSTQFSPFVVPATGKEMPATASPAGSRNLYNTSYVPFHSQGNFGN